MPITTLCYMSIYPPPPIMVTKQSHQYALDVLTYIPTDHLYTVKTVGGLDDHLYKKMLDSFCRQIQFQNLLTFSV